MQNRNRYYAREYQLRTANWISNVWLPYVCITLGTAIVRHTLLPLISFIVTYWGTRWCSWLRHCATSHKVAGSIPDVVNGIFIWHNPSDRTMTLGLTQPLIKVSTRNISWYWWIVLEFGTSRPPLHLGRTPALCARCQIMGDLKIY
jgi:hypothetical protein